MTTLGSKIKVKTWVIESFTVMMILLVIIAVKKFLFAEIICGVAVWVTFMHGQVADRMQEKQSVMQKPDVHCYKWSTRYFLIKESLWIIFFILIKSYAALAGSVLFFSYPFWRKFYRSKLKKG